MQGAQGGRDGLEKACEEGYEEEEKAVDGRGGGAGRAHCAGGGDVAVGYRRRWGIGGKDGERVEGIY